MSEPEPNRREEIIDAALRVADRVALMETGYVRYQGTRDALASNSEVLLRYLGVRRSGH